MMPQNIMVVSDLDHTMVQNEDVQHKRLMAFNHCWNSHVKANMTPSLLVFSTGRSPYLFRALWNASPLLIPDIVICSVGSEIFYNTHSEAATLLGLSQSSSGQDADFAQFYVPDPKWQSILDQGWSRSRIQQLIKNTFPELVVQGDSEQRPHKLSYNLPPKDPSNEEVVNRLRQALSEEGILAKVIYSGGADVDVLSAYAGKGSGLAFVMKRLQEAGYQADYVQVNGDSGNDAELLEVPGVVGCVVSNAHQELKTAARALMSSGTANNIHMATNPCAGGILETMIKHNILSEESPILQCYIPEVLASPEGLTSTSSNVTCRRASSIHDTSTNAVPPQAEAVPPGGTCLGPDGHAIQPDADAVRKAARNVAATPLDNSPCGPGDTGMQYKAVSSQQAADPADFSVLVDRTPAAGVNGDLTTMEGLFEFVWRLGKALVPELLTGAALNRTQGDSTAVHLHAHSPLRLFVTNDCHFVYVSEQSGEIHASSLQQSRVEKGSGAVDSQHEVTLASGYDDPDVVVKEIAQDLSAQGVADAAAEDESSATAWVDQVAVVKKDMQAHIYEATFKVFMLDTQGRRSEKVWFVETTAFRPEEPCPHGFLATRINVTGPLPRKLSQLHLPGVDIE